MRKVQIGAIIGCILLGGLVWASMGCTAQQAHDTIDWFDNLNQPVEVAKPAPVPDVAPVAPVVVATEDATDEKPGLELLCTVAGVLGGASIGWFGRGAAVSRALRRIVT